jgi:antirestriction protein ArdC
MPKSRRKPLTDEERAARREAEREKMAAAVNALRSSAGWQGWLSVRRCFRSYSLKNQILIADQCPHATVVAGFRQWLKLGYAVRKGETSIRIWGPMPPSKKRIEAWKKEGADPETKPGVRFRFVSVFDRSQVDPLPEFPGERPSLEPPSTPIDGDELQPLIPALAALAESIGYSFNIRAVPGSARGYCDRLDQDIVVDVLSGDFSPNAQVKTGVHENAHALVEVDRQDDDPTLSREEEEVVVECVAFTVCGALGLDTSGTSVPYITGWGQSEDIERYASLIDRLARRIEDAVLGSPTESSDRVPALASAA